MQIRHFIERVLKRKSSHSAVRSLNIATQWLFNGSCRSAAHPVKFQWHSVSRSHSRVYVYVCLLDFPPFPSDPTFPRHPVFVYSSCFQSLSAQIWFVAPRSWFWTTIMAPCRGLHQGPSSLRVKRRASVRRYTRMCYARVYFAPRFLARRSGKEESFLFLSHSLTESNCFNLSLCAR